MGAGVSSNSALLWRNVDFVSSCDFQNLSLYPDLPEYLSVDSPPSIVTGKDACKWALCQCYEGMRTHCPGPITAMGSQISQGPTRNTLCGL